MIYMYLFFCYIIAIFFCLPPQFPSAYSVLPAGGTPAGCEAMPYSSAPLSSAYPTSVAPVPSPYYTLAPAPAHPCLPLATAQNVPSGLGTPQTPISVPQQMLAPPIPLLAMAVSPSMIQQAAYSPAPQPEAVPVIYPTQSAPVPQPEVPPMVYPTQTIPSPLPLQMNLKPASLPQQEQSLADTAVQVNVAPEPNSKLPTLAAEFSLGYLRCGSLFRCNTSLSPCHDRAKSLDCGVDHVSVSTSVQQPRLTTCFKSNACDFKTILGFGVWSDKLYSSTVECTL